MDSTAFSSDPRNFTPNRNIATNAVASSAGSFFEGLMPFVSKVQLGKAKNERESFVSIHGSKDKTPEEKSEFEKKIVGLLNTEKMWSFISQDADSYINAENQISRISKGLEEERENTGDFSQIPVESDEQIVESLARMYAVSDDDQSQYSWIEKASGERVMDIADKMRREIDRNNTVRNAILSKTTTQLNALQQSTTEYTDIRPRAKSIFDAIATEVRIKDLIMRSERAIQATGFKGNRDRIAIKRKIESEIGNSNMRSAISFSVKRDANIMIKRLEIANRQFKRELAK